MPRPNKNKFRKKIIGFITNEGWSHFYSFILVLTIFATSMYGLYRFLESQKVTETVINNADDLPAPTPREKDRVFLDHSEKCLSEDKLYETDHGRSNIRVKIQKNGEAFRYASYNNSIKDLDLQSFLTKAIECPLDKITINVHVPMKEAEAFAKITASTNNMYFHLSSELELNEAIKIANIIKPTNFVVERGFTLKRKDVCDLELGEKSNIRLGVKTFEFSELRAECK